jgi:hypothetical protein
MEQRIVVRGRLLDPTHIELDEPVTVPFATVEIVLRSARTAASLPSESDARRATSSRDQEIEALYAEVHALAVATEARDPTNEARFQDRLARLRELQDAEVREMAAFAQRILRRAPSSAPCSASTPARGARA